VPEMRKFPVFSLMIRELTRESSSHQTAPSATSAKDFKTMEER